VAVRAAVERMAKEYQARPDCPAGCDGIAALDEAGAQQICGWRLSGCRRRSNPARK
jgi:hypothetical protein